jgi:hypothetical protein
VTTCCPRLALQLALTLARTQVKWLPEWQLESVGHQGIIDRLTQLFTGETPLSVFKGVDASSSHASYVSL